MRVSASVVAAVLPGLAAVALAVVLIATAAITAVSHCRCCPARRSCLLPTSPPLLPRYPVVLTTLPSLAASPLLLFLQLLLPPHCPRPGPCCWPPPLLPHNLRPCRRRRRNTLLSVLCCSHSSHPCCHLCCHCIAPTLADAAVEADLSVDCYVPTAVDFVAACCSLLLPLVLIIGCSSSSS